MSIIKNTNTPTVTVINVSNFQPVLLLLLETIPIIELLNLELIWQKEWYGRMRWCSWIVDLVDSKY